MSIPAKHAEIFYNSNDTGTPTEDVFVCDRRSRNLGTSDHIQMSHFRGSHGAVFKDWMNDDRVDMTPEFVFARIWLNATDRVSQAALKAALSEFGKIDRCAWAREMSAALEECSDYGMEG